MLTSWGDGTNYCGWQGVTCNDEGGVIFLSLNCLTSTPGGVVDAPKLGGVVPSAEVLEGLFNLEQLFLGRCGIGGQLPVRLPPPLQILHLYDNAISGTLPDWSAPQLRSFELRGNQLTGTLPDWEGLPMLNGVGLWANKLTGTLPRAWGIGPWGGRIEVLELHSNQLVGDVPAEWAQMAALRQVYLCYNAGLTGCTPAQWQGRLDFSCLTVGTGITGFC